MTKLRAALWGTVCLIAIGAIIYENVQRLSQTPSPVKLLPPITQTENREPTIVNILPEIILPEEEAPVIPMEKVFPIVGVTDASIVIKADSSAWIRYPDGTEELLLEQTSSSDLVEKALENTKRVLNKRDNVSVDIDRIIPFEAILVQLPAGAIITAKNSEKLVVLLGPDVITYYPDGRIENSNDPKDEP